MDFTVHISEAGEEYNEKIEVDPDKQTELFEVPAHPGVDRSDTLHDFKHVSYIILFSLLYYFHLFHSRNFSVGELFTFVIRTLCDACHEERASH